MDKVTVEHNLSRMPEEIFLIGIDELSGNTIVKDIYYNLKENSGSGTATFWNMFGNNDYQCFAGAKSITANEDMIVFRTDKLFSWGTYFGRIKYKWIALA